MAYTICILCRTIQYFRKLLNRILILICWWTWTKITKAIICNFLLSLLLSFWIVSYFTQIKKNRKLSSYSFLWKKLYINSCFFSKLAVMAREILLNSIKFISKKIWISNSVISVTNISRFLEYRRIKVSLPPQ